MRDSNFSRKRCSGEAVRDIAAVGVFEAQELDDETVFDAVFTQERRNLEIPVLLISLSHLLERLFLIRRLPAWHGNRSKRLVKTPNLHFADSDLAPTLEELEPWGWNAQRSRFGHLLESFVLQQLIAMEDGFVAQLNRLDA